MEFDPAYIVERILFITLYSIFFVVFAFQNYVRIFQTTPKQKLIEPKNAKSINQLAGLSASFWAVICWIDVHHVFMSTPAELNEFAFAAAFCSFITSYVIHVSIALRVLTVSVFFGKSDEKKSRWWSTANFAGQSGVVYWASLASPWLSAILMALLMTGLDRAWPNIIFLVTAAFVVTIAATRLVYIRRRIATELRRINPNEDKMYARGMKNMQRWRTFTRWSVVLVGLCVINAMVFCYVFLTEDIDTPVVFLDPLNYTLDGNGFTTIAGIVLMGLLLSSLWFSWVKPGIQAQSSGQTGTNNSVKSGSVTHSGSDFTTTKSTHVGGSGGGASSSQASRNATHSFRYKTETVVEVNHMKAIPQFDDIQANRSDSAWSSPRVGAADAPPNVYGNSAWSSPQVGTDTPNAHGNAAWSSPQVGTDTPNVHGNGAWSSPQVGTQQPPNVYAANVPPTPYVESYRSGSRVGTGQPHHHAYANVPPTPYVGSHRSTSQVGSDQPFVESYRCTSP